MRERRIDCVKGIPTEGCKGSHSLLSLDASTPLCVDRGTEVSVRHTMSPLLVYSCVQHMSCGELPEAEPAYASLCIQVTIRSKEDLIELLLLCAFPLIDQKVPVALGW
jgi:hypothetical protein